jgi:PAS domain S-box-containing protein
MVRANTAAGSLRERVWGYGLAVASVAMALGTGLLLEHQQLEGVALSLFLFAVAVTSWYAGAQPGIVATVLSALCFDYFFSPPLYSLAFASKDLGASVALVSFALLITRFSAVRHRVEDELRHARDALEAEVVVRTQQASLLDLTHDTIFVRGMDDVITYWNRGAEDLYGWTPEQAIGQRARELLRTEFPLPREEIAAELLRTGRWDGELTNAKADGARVVVASRWSLQRGQRDEPIAVMETNNDVTERKRWEDDIRALNQELAKRAAEVEASNKELEAFAYSVSHDLRAPLRHTAGYAELLQKAAAGLLDAKSLRYLAMILESAKRMGNLIDDLLAFSRIGRTEARKTVVDMDQLVADVLGELRPETAGRDVVWNVHPLPACYADRSMLRLVLMNLLSNAIKFTRGRPRAEIEIGCERDGGDAMVTFVRDNGAGFDMKYAHKLFGVFQRLHPANAFEGTGIGLATVQRIVHRHGGTVRAEGAVDGGATFHFSIPKP